MGGQGTRERRSSGRTTPHGGALLSTLLASTQRKEERMSSESPELTIDEQIAAVIQPLRDLDSQLAREEAHCRNELEEIIAKRKRLTAMLRQADPSIPGPGRKKSEAPKANPPTISEGRINQVLAVVAGIEGEWSTGVVARLIEVERSQLNKALIHLRERGQVRLVRQQKGRGDGSIYVTTPRGAEEGQQELIVASNGIEPS